MATIKAFTDLKQSRKLAEILPLESADMHFTNSSAKGEMYVDQFKAACSPYSRAKDALDAYAKIVNNTIVWEVIPCWSLVSLLNVINKDYYTTLFHDGVSWTITITHHDDNNNKHSVWSAEPLDACYDMIIKLNSMSLLYHEKKNE